MIPFGRRLFRARNGYWCTHADKTYWHTCCKNVRHRMLQRQCKACGLSEFMDV